MFYDEVIKDLFMRKISRRNIRALQGLYVSIHNNPYIRGFTIQLSWQDNDGSYSIEKDIFSPNEIEETCEKLTNQYMKYWESQRYYNDFEVHTN